jgi:uncharacterized delta-60 repeat protein
LAVPRNNLGAAQQNSSFGSTTGAVSGLAGSLSSLAVQPDGSIVGVESGTGFQPVIARFDSSGQPDGTTFDDVSPYLATISSVAVQPVSGGFAILAGGSGFNVARFNSDGSLDTAFGGDGIASPVIPGQGSQVNLSQLPSNLLVQADTKVVLVGLLPDVSGAEDLELVRYTADGQLDPSFGYNGDGIVTYDVGAATSCDAVIEPGGDIVAAVGLPSSGQTDVLPFSPSGQPDTTFAGWGGMMTTYAIVSDPLIALQPDGDIDLAGGNGSGGYYALEQLPVGGDRTGWTVASAGTGQVEALAVQPAGRIVAAIDSVMENSWTLRGFKKVDGTADSTFNGSGISVSHLTGSAAALAVQPNGDILLAGQADATDAFFARYGQDTLAVNVGAAPSVAPTGLSLTVDGSSIGGTDGDRSGFVRIDNV